VASILAAGVRPQGQPVWTRLFTPERIRALTSTVSTVSTAPADGLLSGMPFAVKDNLDIAGEPTSGAFPPLAAGPAQRTATAVQRLIDAGAIPVGKTNLDQFATGLVGTRTPYGACHAVGHPDHISGGSSSGSAVAVALGLVPLALGTDTAGSGRVPAAFNGIVGMKPTRGLVSTSGLLPACRSLDCVSVFTRTVAEARDALRVLAAPDGADPYSRTRPAHQPLVPIEPRVVAVPDLPLDLDLDPEHRAAWDRAVSHVREVAQQVATFDPGPFLEAARLLYQGPWIAERWHSIGPLLGDSDIEHPDLDPAVRAVLRGARDVSGPDVFAGFDRLAALRRATEPVWATADAILLPVTPGHPTHAQIAADPVGQNARLGAYTNFVNLLDLCAIALPAGLRDDGLPFGVQLIAPAFHDEALLDLAARWSGEKPRETAVPPGETLLAVAGAHLSGLQLNGQLLALGARLRFRSRTAPGYRLYRLPGDGIARPALVHTGDGPATGIAVEVWQLSHGVVGVLLDTVPAPLGFGRLALASGEDVTGFLAQGPVPAGAQDLSQYGGWREYLAHHAAAS
jgi:allophanate hydrolase